MRNAYMVDHCNCLFLRGLYDIFQNTEKVIGW